MNRSFGFFITVAAIIFIFSPSLGANPGPIAPSLGANPDRHSLSLRATESHPAEATSSLSATGSLNAFSLRATESLNASSLSATGSLNASSLSATDSHATESLGATPGLSASSHRPTDRRAVDYVNPLIGTMSCTDLSCGNTYPAVNVPFGMHNWTAHTGKMALNGYVYTYQTNYLQGFKQTHQPSLWVADYGAFSIMPVTDKANYTEDGRRSWYSHKTEISKPFYYKVFLGDPQAYVEFTATERAAKFRITYDGPDSAYLVLDAFKQGSCVRILPEKQTIVGYASSHGRNATAGNFRNYFVLKFDKPFSSAATWDESGLKESVLELSGDRTGALIGFDLKRGECVEIDIASSYISDAQALLNLKEVEGRSFEAVMDTAADAWENELGRIRLEPQDAEGTKSAQRRSRITENTQHPGARGSQKPSISGEERLETFYSAYYRMLSFPRKFYEYDASGNIYHYSPYTGEVLPGYMYADNGFWDTFRTEYPFFTLMHRGVVSEVMQSLQNIYRESGWLPEWFSPGHIDCMIGSHSASVIADAYLNGIEGMDIDLLYEGILKNTTAVGPVSSVGRTGADYYNAKGYIPCDIGLNQDASRTLEYAYDDYCIMKLASALGRPEEEVALFRERARNYRNLFDPATRLMRPREESGAFQKEFDPFRWGDHFTEANSWQYTWFVPQDVEGLKSLMGGEQAFFEMMDSVMTMPQTYDISYYKRGIIHLIREMQSGGKGQYAHHNEPMHHFLYMYNFGQPWKTQYWVRKVMDEFYTAAPDGYLGEEDNGQMSAWYVMSALGLYPLTPCSGQFVFGSPLFKSATLTLENGKTIEITAEASRGEITAEPARASRGKTIETSANAARGETIAEPARASRGKTIETSATAARGETWSGSVRSQGGNTSNFVKAPYDKDKNVFGDDRPDAASGLGSDASKTARIGAAEGLGTGASKTARIGAAEGLGTGASTAENVFGDGRFNNSSGENIYVDRIKVNGKITTANYIEISKLRNGARINFRMSPTPNTTRGTAPGDYPYSLTTEK